MADLCRCGHGPKGHVRLDWHCEDCGCSDFRRPTAERPICGIVSLSGGRGEPLACGFPEGHKGSHAWATLPTFASPGEPSHAH
jgi:hypothetical protein